MAQFQYKYGILLFIARLKAYVSGAPCIFLFSLFLIFLLLLCFNAVLLLLFRMNEARRTECKKRTKERKKVKEKIMKIVKKIMCDSWNPIQKIKWRSLNDEK